MRTTFCKYLDRSSRLLPLLNPPFVLGPVRPGPSASLTSPSFKLRIHQSTSTRSHHPVVQVGPPPQRRREKLYNCLPPGLSFIYSCHATWTISRRRLFIPVLSSRLPSAAPRLLRSILPPGPSPVVTLARAHPDLTIVGTLHRIPHGKDTAQHQRHPCDSPGRVYLGTGSPLLDLSPVSQDHPGVPIRRHTQGQSSAWPRPTP